MASSSSKKITRTQARRQTPVAATPKARMLADLAKSGLTEADAKRLGYVPKSAAQSAELGLARAGEGYVLPAHDADGNETGDFQFRYFDTEVQSGFLKGQKMPKYLQPSGTDPAIDLPPIGGKSWNLIAADTNQPVVITEGFKKAAACTSLTEYPCIGVTGVWNFKQTRKGHYDMIPVLKDALQWNGRVVYVTYDSDAAMNEQVVKAENALARELTKRGPLVFIVRIPPDGQKKVGLDDYIVKHGPDAFKFLLTGPDTKPYVLAKELHDMAEDFGIVQSLASVIEYPTANHAECRFHSADKFHKIVASHRTMKVNPDTGEVSGNAFENTKTVSVAKKFLEWPSAPRFDHVEYAPGKSIVTETNGYNVHRAACIEPKAGNTVPFDRLMEHLVREPQQRKHLWQWFAAPLQEPGLRINHGVVLWSQKRGVGKTALGLVVARQHGEGNYCQIRQDDAESSFNGWQLYKTFVCIEEIRGESIRDSKRFANSLKTFITNDRIRVNEKFIAAFEIDNTVNYYLSSNSMAALITDDLERRYFVIHVNEDRLDDDFWHEFWTWANSEQGKAALLDKLLRVDMTGFNAKGDAPRTEAFFQMVAAGRSDLQDWVAQLREDPASVLSLHGTQMAWASSPYATLDELYSVFTQSNEHCRSSKKQLALELAAAGFEQANGGKLVRVPGTEVRLRLWIIGTLRAANVRPSDIGTEYAKGRYRVPKRKEVGR